MSDYHEPPNIDSSKLDFSEFHPLDHWPWQPRCREFFGGWRHHLAISWEYRHGPNVRKRLGRLCCCWWGHHKPGQAWMRDGPRGPWVTLMHCRWCFKRLSEPQPS